MNLTIHALVAARKNIEEAWDSTLAMLGMDDRRRRKSRPISHICAASGRLARAGVTLRFGDSRVENRDAL